MHLSDFPRVTKCIVWGANYTQTIHKPYIQTIHRARQNGVQNYTRSGTQTMHSVLWTRIVHELNWMEFWTRMERMERMERIVRNVCNERDERDERDERNERNERKTGNGNRRWRASSLPPSLPLFVSSSLLPAASSLLQVTPKNPTILSEFSAIRH